MAINSLPQFIQDNYEIHEWRHAITILRHEFPEEYGDLIEMLENFRLRNTAITVGGQGKSLISGALDGFLYGRNWLEKHFTTRIIVDGVATETATHKVDCFRNRVALDIEWNNKTEFYDRDLNNYRLLHERGAISLGIIVTRTTELQKTFNQLGIGSKYGSSTTHMDKLVPRIHGGSGGGCPLLIFGIKDTLYDPNS